MNERIQELADQMDQSGIPYQAGDILMTITDRYLEKFAELLVRECADIAEQKQTYNDGHGIHLNIDQCILSEFGVEK
jgi:hypothetical protein